MIIEVSALSSLIPRNWIFLGASSKSYCDRCGACLDLTSGPDPSMKIQQVSVKNLPRSRVSLSVWVSLNSTKGAHDIFITESSDGSIGYRLQSIDGKVRWSIGTDNTPIIFDETTKDQVIPEALWTHILVSYNNDNGMIRIFSNGILKLNSTSRPSSRDWLPYNWDSDASIGDKTFNGYMDEFIMYNWDLDPSEVMYVRNYCADHPKLVRFTVRVPLTRRRFVPHAKNSTNRSP